MSSVLKNFELDLDILSGQLVYVNTSLQKVRLSKNGTTLSVRKEINFIEGNNISLILTDNPINDRLDITINSTATGSEEMADYTTLIDEVNDSVTYIGYGNPGTLSSSNGWKIKRITIVDNDVKIEYASGDKLFDKNWENRAIYSYS